MEKSKNRKGGDDMKKGNVTIWILLVVILIGGGAYFYQQNQSQKEKTMIGEKKMKQNVAMEDDKKVEDDKMVKKDEMMKSRYSGKVLAGKSAPYLEFNQADYDKALKEGKIVLLDFYANWCPICRAEEPNIKQGFNELTNSQVIGFRVNFNDNDTDDDEKKLAETFKIPYQHTKVILKDSKEVFRTSDAWEKDTLLMEINKIVKER